MIVQKFGGSSLATLEHIKNVAKIIEHTYKENHPLVVVLSAMGDTTDKLINLGTELNPRYSKREMDALLSTGEQVSVALMAVALHGYGLPAVSLNAAQAGIFAGGDFGNARIQKIVTERIKQELERKNIVVITGFQGINKYGDIATLGRGGSDTTAVAVACALGAEKCEIFTDVDGIYTADPNLVKTAEKLDEIGYDEMLELASMGAKVLHNRSVELAKKYNLNLVVKSSLQNNEGTVVKEKTMEKMLMSGLAVDKNIAKITVIGMKDAPGIAFKLFSLIAKKNIIVDIIVQTLGGSIKKDIAFTVSTEDLPEALETLQKNQDFLAYENLHYTENLAKLSVVGAGMTSNPGVAAAMFEALYDAGINIKMISTSEIKISVLIKEEDAKQAANAVHDRLIRE